MTAAQQPLTVQQAAELRLGRPLTLAERRIDIAGIDRDLARGKARLHRAIDKEKRRAINAHFRYGKPLRLHITPEMRKALNWLYAQGVKHARAEVRLATGKRYANEHSVLLASDQPDKARNKLRNLLHRLQLKVVARVGEATGGAMLDGFGAGAQLVMARTVAQMPGALDVASQLVSTAMYEGMGSVFDQAAGLFTTWEYSAVMDNGTCEPCADLDGEEYESWEAIQLDLPDGGPNPACDGGDRCRCRAVPGAVAAPG